MFSSALLSAQRMLDMKLDSQDEAPVTASSALLVISKSPSFR